MGKATEQATALLSIRETSDVKDPDINRLWQTRIENQIQFLKDHWNGWTSWKNAYKLDSTITSVCKQEIKSNYADVDEITVPLIATHIRNLLPFLYNRKPEFFAVPMGDDEQVIQNAYSQQDYLNGIWRMHDMDKQAKRAVLDAAIIGHGVIKTGWGLELEAVTSDNEPKKGNPNYRNYIKSEAPFIRRVNPFFFMFDRFAPDNDLDSARWCCEIILHTLQDLVDNNFYDAKIRKMLEMGEITPFLAREYEEVVSEQAELFDNRENEPSSPDDLCVVYRVYDRKFGNIFSLIPGHYDHILSNNSWDQFYGHLPSFPFRKLDFEEVPNEPNGIGHVHYLADLQAQIQRNRNKIFGTSRMYNPKYVHIGRKTLSAAESNKLRQDKPGVVIHIEANEQLLPLESPTLSSDVYRASEMLSSDYSEISGSDILARGGLLPSRTSAQEIKERRRLRGLRLETNVENTNKFLLNIGQDIIRYAKIFARRELIVEVTNRPGVSWNQISPSELKDNKVAIHLDLVSKEEQSPETIRQAFLQMIQQVSNPNVYQLLQQAGVAMDINRLWSEYIRTFGIASLTRSFPNQQLPQIDLQNTGQSPSIPSGDPATTQLQGANVDASSIMQGLFPQGNLEPTNY